MSGSRVKPSDADDLFSQILSPVVRERECGKGAGCCHFEPLLQLHPRP